MTQQFVNNFSTTVASTFGIADIYLNLTSAAGLPTLSGADFCLLTVYRQTGVVESGHEVVKVTAIVGNQCTVVRSHEGAAASQFLAGDRVQARFTALAMEDKVSQEQLTDGLALKINSSLIGAASGVAPLDAGGKVAASYLPGYVDDVLEYANLASFPGTGETGIMYIAVDTNKTYRWSGSVYVEISASPGTTDAVTEGATNKYFTEARVLATVLTGLSLATSTAVTAADSILVAVGKLQKQLTDLIATVATKVTLTGVETLTNKRITKRVNTITTSSTPTPAGDTTDMFTVTALAGSATFAAPTGTPTDGQPLMIRIKDNGTARTLAWNPIYVAGSDVALPTTTVISKTMYVGFFYDAALTKWVCMSVTAGI
jgi:hypothetical protein